MAPFAWWCPHWRKPFQMLVGPGAQGMEWLLPQYRDSLAAGSLPPAARQSYMDVGSRHGASRVQMARRMTVAPLSAEQVGDSAAPAGRSACRDIDGGQVVARREARWRPPDGRGQALPDPVPPVPQDAPMPGFDRRTDERELRLRLPQAPQDLGEVVQADGDVRVGLAGSLRRPDEYAVPRRRAGYRTCCWLAAAWQRAVHVVDRRLAGRPPQRRCLVAGATGLRCNGRGAQALMKLSRSLLKVSL
jgi:hypothetical protein